MSDSAIALLIPVTRVSTVRPCHAPQITRSCASGVLWHFEYVAMLNRWSGPRKEGGIRRFEVQSNKV